MIEESSTLCKLVSQHLTSFGGFPWVVGKWMETKGTGQICGPGWLHYYSHPLVSEIMNSIHENYPKKAKLFLVEAGDTRIDEWSKCATTRLRLTTEIERPMITSNQRIRCGIYLIQCFGIDTMPEWDDWADGWISASDRSEDSANHCLECVYKSDNDERVLIPQLRSVHAAGWSICSQYHEFVSDFVSDMVQLVSESMALVVSCVGLNPHQKSIDLASTIKRAMDDEDELMGVEQGLS